jgi:ferredoxin
MEEPRYTREEVAARGRAIYEQRIRDTVEPEQIGKFLVIDIETGEYELDEDDVAAMKRAAQKHPVDSLYGMRVGYPTMGRIGARLTRGKG